MCIVKHIIAMNNRSNSSFQLRENESGAIVLENHKEGNKIFQTKQEFMAWMKGHTIHSIQSRALAR